MRTSILILTLSMVSVSVEAQNTPREPEMDKFRITLLRIRSEVVDTEKWFSIFLEREEDILRFFTENGDYVDLSAYHSRGPKGEYECSFRETPNLYYDEVDKVIVCDGKKYSFFGYRYRGKGRR